ncbi:MAG: hypothetical protein FWG50_01390 [Kiritimatiellaeota bacterium]|nr:hypothetical protein [Kiritimatiellota bacterium]
MRKLFALGIVGTALAVQGQQDGMPPAQTAEREVVGMNLFFGLKTENPGRVFISPSAGEGASAAENLALIDRIRAIAGDTAEAAGNAARVNSVRQTLGYAPLDFKAGAETEAAKVLGLIRWEIANFTRATNQIDRLGEVNRQIQERGEAPVDLAVEIPRSAVAHIRAITVDFAETGPMERLRKLMTSPYRSDALEIVADAKARQDGMRVTRDMAAAKAMRILGYAKENNIPPETVLEEAKAVARSSREAVEAGASPRPHEELRNCECMLHLLDEAGDLPSLPFIEEMSGMDDEGIRLCAVMAHMRLAGIGSLGFIRRAAADERYAKMNWHAVYSNFFRLIRQKGQDNPRGVEWDSLCAFLLERVLEERRGDIAESLDRFLCTGLPDYSGSTQRLAVTRRFAERDNSAYFRKAKEEAEKIPADKRTDLSGRFKLPPVQQGNGG